MKCKNCGSLFPEGAIFCPSCGTKGKKLYNKVILIAVLVVILLGAILATLLYVRSTIKDEDDYENVVFYSSLSNQFYNLKGDSYQPENIDSVYYSRLGEITAYTEGEGETLNLFCFKKDMTPVSIAKDVCSVNISVTGEHVVYTTYDGENSYETTLYIYNVSKDKSIKIDTKVYPYEIALSPSGKAVAYLKDYEGYEDNTLYIAGINDKPKKIDKDGYYPVAISDNGKNLYYVNTNDKFYYYNGKDIQKIQVDVGSSFWFNDSITEVLFTKGSRTYYFKPKMDEPVKIANYAMDDYLTGNSSMYMMDYCSNYGHVINKDTLKETLIFDDNTLLWINKDLTDVVKVASLSGYHYQLSENEKSFLFLENGDLYKVTNFNEEMEPVLLYDDEYISAFKASRDLSKIYLVTEENELYYYRNNRKPVKLSTDITLEFSNLAYNEFIDKIYYIEDNKLFCAGTKNKSVTVMEEDTNTVYQFGNGIMFIKNTDYGMEYYYLKDKEAIKLYSTNE